MKPSVFVLCTLWLFLSAAVQAAPPATAPAATTTARPVCPAMQGGKMASGTACPCMQGAKMANGVACPGMQGGQMGPGMMGNGPCPCMQGKGAAPAAATQSAVADTSNPAVYGWNLMTHEERAAYRTKMRAAKTAAERASICSEHNKAMSERAKQQGVTLPAVPNC
jgi:hypothetical protein